MEAVSAAEIMMPEVFVGTEKKKGFKAAGLTDAVSSVVSVVVVMVIGLVIITEVYSAVAIDNASPFYDLYTSLPQSIGTGYKLLAILLIVVPAAYIMRYVNLF